MQGKSRVNPAPEVLNPGQVKAARRPEAIDVFEVGIRSLSMRSARGDGSHSGFGRSRERTPSQLGLDPNLSRGHGVSCHRKALGFEWVHSPKTPFAIGLEPRTTAVTVTDKRPTPFTKLGIRPPIADQSQTPLPQSPIVTIFKNSAESRRSARNRRHIASAHPPMGSSLRQGQRLPILDCTPGQRTTRARSKPQGPPNGFRRYAG
jgi:hypothetical protein